MKNIKKTVAGTLIATLAIGGATVAGMDSASAGVVHCPTFLSQQSFFYRYDYKLYTETAKKCTYIQYRYNVVTNKTTRIGYKSWDRSRFH